MLGRESLIRLGVGKRMPLMILQQQRGLMSRAAKQIKEKVPGSAATRMFPKFMAKYAAKIGGAPMSHLTSFLLIHELTAIVPLFGIWGAFYYLDYVPLGMPDWLIENGSEFIRKMAQRNNWDIMLHAETGAKIVAQGAASYAIVKAVLPLRLIFSLWCTPWVARRVVGPILGAFKRAKKTSTGPDIKQGILPETLNKKKIEKKHDMQDQL